MPLLLQDDIDFSSILWSCIMLTPRNLEIVILQRFQLCSFFAQSPPLTVTREKQQQSPFIFHSAVPVNLISSTRTSNHFLHSVNFVLIKTSSPSSKYYFPMLLSFALYGNEKLCKQLTLKASLENAPLLKIPIISHCNTEVVYYKILHLHHWSHLGLILIKQKTVMAPVLLLNPQITVADP